MTSESPGDPRLLERLEESVSGGAALRQLRRRYSLLHADYERLLGRLEDLEDQIGAPAATPAAARDTRLTDGIAAPLLEMGSQYADAAADMLRIVEGLQVLAGGGEARATPRLAASLRAAAPAGAGSKSRSRRRPSSSWSTFRSG